MKKTIVLPLLSGMLLVLPWPQQGWTDPLSVVEERINASNKHFTAAATAAPEVEQIVTVSFTKPLLIRKAVRKAQTYGLVVEGFRHGFGEFTGGYTIASDEPLDEAIQRYELFLTQYIDQGFDRPTDSPEAVDEEATEAWDKTAGEVKQMKRWYQIQGVEIIGIDLRGKGKDLMRFQQQESTVRMMELRTGSRRNAAILPWQ